MNGTFRTRAGIEAERQTRQRVEPLLERHCFIITGRRFVAQGSSAITEIIDAVDVDEKPVRMRVPLYWRRGRRKISETLYSAAQLRARLNEGGWAQTLANIAARDKGEGLTHLLSVRDRANGRCERLGCDQQRRCPGFLDVHHIFGIADSDRVWTCVAFCPNCHREAHFSPEREAINEALHAVAIRFKP